MIIEVLSIMPDRPVRDQWEWLPEENGRTFSYQTGPTKKNGSCHGLFLFWVPYISESYWRQVEQWKGFYWNTEFPSGRSDRPKWTTSPRRGSEYSGRNEPNGPIRLISERNFWSVWPNWKHLKTEWNLAFERSGYKPLSEMRLRSQAKWNRNGSDFRWDWNVLGMEGRGGVGEWKGRFKIKNEELRLENEFYSIFLSRGRTRAKFTLESDLY